MSDLTRPKPSPGMSEMLETMYKLSGDPNKPSFLEKLFAPIPMEAELGAAGLAPEEARFIATQLDRNGYVIVPKSTT